MEISSMNFIVYYSLFIYFTVKTSKTLPTMPSFRIDDFIHQLMTSDKFNELTDIIANKAAQKIKDLEVQNTSYIGKYELRQLEQKKESSDKSELESNEDNENSKEMHSKSIESSVREKDKHKPRAKLKHYDTTLWISQNKGSDYNIERFGKIDHTASKELELNFKHLKGQIRNHRFKIKNNSQGTKFKKHNEKHFDYDEGDANGKPKDRSLIIPGEESSIQQNNSSHETLETDGSSNDLSNFNDTEDIVKEKNISEENSSENKLDFDKKVNENSVLRDKKQINKLKRTSKSVAENEKTKTLIEEVTKKVSNELNPKPTSKETLEVNLSAIADDLKTNASKVSKQDDKKLKKGSKRGIVREENGKKYILQSSVEYAEYFEKFDKQTKTATYTNTFQ